MAFSRRGFIVTLVFCLLLLADVYGQVSNDTRAFPVGGTTTLPCTGVPYDGVTKHWEKNPVLPIKYLVAIQTPLGQSSPSAPFYDETNIAAAGLTGRFTVANDLMTATITAVRETDDGDYRCASGASEIIHKLVIYKLDSVRIQPPGTVEGYVGGTFDVTCDADSKPTPSFNWTKQGDSSFTATGATLRISSLTMNHTGTYVCTAYHAYASDTASVQLTVSEAELTVAPTSQGRTGGPNDGSNAPQTGGANTGAIVGGVIGATAFVGVMVAVAFFVLRKKRADRGEKDGVESGNDEVTYHAAGHPGAPENMSRPPPNQPEVMYAELDLKNAPAGSRKPYVATPDDSPTEYAQIRPSKPPRSTVPHTLAPDDKTEYASITKPKPNKRLDLQAV
ncbi:PREDICTED: uncharacterized protein LOC109468593 isoform X2 [Branchiostoma belcheri]|uniref:Uncharacterized protein LOC109468593 isoform X2 n=1 Tax=Branchiostoma belcheri TaxID=7741 RepID=A0A6P4Y0P5_BRABE|nr:PREDICTED: uncharacterized protein LOC109468593 isoform X2 [Branchiostoma belcheri]